MLEEIIRAGVVMPAPEREPDFPPVVPPENKELWNYMGSPTLLDAVEGGIVSQQEAEVVMEIASYRRSVNYTALAVGLSPAKRQRSPAPSGERVIELYESGIIKLRRWLSK